MSCIYRCIMNHQINWILSSKHKWRKRDRRRTDFCKSSIEKKNKECNTGIEKRSKECDSCIEKRNKECDTFPDISIPLWKIEMEKESERYNSSWINEEGEKYGKLSMKIRIRNLSFFLISPRHVILLTSPRHVILMNHCERAFT